MPLTSALIVAEALAIAKCPGFTAQGGRALNLVLQDLVMHRNLKVNLIVGSMGVIPAGSLGPFDLPANYLRMYDLFYVVDDTPYFLTQTNKLHYDSHPGKASIRGNPSEWSSNLSFVATGGLPVFTIFPASNSQITLQGRYFCRRDDISVPETSQTIPWFEDQDYLIQATALRMMRITDDSRYGIFEGNCTRMIRDHLFKEGDEQQVLKTIGLDPLRFKSGSRLKATKADPF